MRSGDNRAKETVMRVVVLVHPGNPAGYENGEMPESSLLEKMMKFNTELVDAGVMLAGEGFHPSSKGARVQFDRSGNASVSEGPFADLTNLVGGFWLWKVNSFDEALAWARRAPMEPGATLEIRRVFESEEFGEEIAAQENELRKKIDHEPGA